jgi:hypothetical protein
LALGGRSAFTQFLTNGGFSPPIAPQSVRCERSPLFLSRKFFNFSMSIKYQIDVLNPVHWVVEANSVTVFFIAQEIIGEIYGSIEP